MMRRTHLAVLATTAAFALSGCGFHGLYSANLPGGPDLGGHPYTVNIQFADVLDLVPQSNVKVNDVAVGKVQSVSLDGWHAKVTVRVNGKVKLPANARAAVKQSSLLGEKFVDLEQPLGEPEGTLKNGDTIPLRSTGTAPEVEEVLGALSLLLNGGGLQQIRTITTELNKALKGNEAGVRDLLTQLNGFVGTLDRQKSDITTALVKIDALAATLNRQKQTIIATLETFPQALKILSDERGKLTEMLTSLARLGTVATHVITATQTDLVSGLRSLAPVLEHLTAAGQDLPGALNMMLTFPFPVDKATQFIKSDYANLSLHLDISLNDNLCGLNIQALCDLISTLVPSKPQAAAHSTRSVDSAVVPLSALPGLGG